MFLEFDILEFSMFIRFSEAVRLKVSNFDKFLSLFLGRGATSINGSVFPAGCPSRLKSEL